MATAQPFDTKIPVTWALGLLATAFITVGGAITQMRDMNAQLTKLEEKLDRRDDNFQSLLNKFSETSAKLSVLDMRVAQNEKDTTAIRLSVQKIELQK